MDGGSVSAPAASPAPASASATQQPAATDSGAAPDSTQAATPAQSDDPEFDLGGEKLKRSEYKRLRELEAKRKEYDRAASLRFEEASKKEKAAAAREAQAQALVGELSKDTKAKLRAAGIDPVKFAEETLAEALAEDSLTPEQIELRDLKAEKAKRAEEAEAENKRQLASQEDAHVASITDSIANDFLSALKPRNLPERDLQEIVGRMAYRVEALLDSGVPIDLEAIAEEVTDRFYAAPEDRLSSLTDDQLLERHPALVERVRKALLAKSQQSPKQPSKTPATTGKAAASKRGITMAELQERIDKRLGV